MAEDGRLKRIWRWLSNISTFWTWASIAGAFITTAREAARMPGGWDDPLVATTLGAWFFGTWACIAGVIGGVKYVWKIAHPPSVEIALHGGEDASLAVCPSVSGDFYGTGWLLGEVARRHRPFMLNWGWGPHTGQYLRIRGHDKATIVIAALDMDESDPALVVCEVNDGEVQRWPLQEVVRQGFPNDLPWINFRIELRAKQFSNVWKHEYRFRLNKGRRFEIEEVTPSAGDTASRRIPLRGRLRFW